MKNTVWLFAVAFLLSCGTQKDEDVVIIAEEVPETADTEIFLDDEPEEVLPLERPVYRAAETILTDLVHTKLEVNFDWEKSRMNGVATITAKPHFYPSDSLILDAKGMEIKSVSLDKRTLKYIYKDDVLRINLGKTFTRNDSYTVVIEYIAKPEEREAKGSMAITSDKGLYFINPTGEEKGKMPQIWTQGETEASSVWFPTIDSPNANTTQEILMTVDDKYTTLSNGKLISSKKIADGKRIDHWKQDLPHSPYLFMMAVGEFKVVKDTYTRPDGTLMDVHYYVEPEWEQYARDIFGETPEMIRFFSERLGVEYPWDKYHQIVVRDYVSGAMENTGAVIFGDFVYKNDRELLDENDQSTIAHELFHHWFGDLVTAESWSNLPLNESFANYSQYLWDEHRYGIDEADYRAEIEADGYYQSAQMQGYHDLIWFDYDDKEQMFDGHSYNKGGRILHMLRNYLGDEAFFAGLTNYLQQNKFKPAEFHQLRLAFEEVSGEDLNWFFNQWFLGSAHPVLDFNHEIDQENKQLVINVEQQQNLELSPLYKLPVNIAVFDNDGKHVYPVTIDSRFETFTFPFNGEVKGIHFDDQFMLLAKFDEDKTSEQYIFQYYNGERFAARRDGLMNGSKFQGDEGQQLILDAMGDEFWKIRELATGRAKKLKGEFKDEGKGKLMSLAMNDENSHVREAALKALSKMMEKDELEPLLVDRIQKDRSYAVVSEALSSYGKINPEEAIRLAEALENERSSKMLFGISQIYAGFGGEDKYAFFEKALEGNVVQGFDKLGVMSSFTYYLTRMEPEYAAKAIDMYEEMSKHGGFYMKMFLPQNLSYLIKDFDKKINELELELAKHEENNDAAYADKTRKKIAKYKEVKESYVALSENLEKEKQQH